MKRATKIISVLLAIMILSVLASINVFATQTSQDGLEVQIVTDKESYTVNENIKTTITIKNTNDYEISNLSIKSNMPDGLTLVDGDTSLTQESLKSNESANLVFTSKVISEEKETNPPTTQKPTSTATNDVVNQDNNDSTTIKTGGQPIYTIIVSVLFFISALAVTIAVFLNRKNRTKFKSTISMILCLTIVGTSFIGLNVFNAKATEISQNTKSVEVYKNIKVDNKEYKISATISYDIKETEITPTTPDSDDIQLTIDQNDFTTSNAIVKISGTFNINSNVVSISYTEASEIDDYEIDRTGEAVINDNKWTVEKLFLKDGENIITFKATELNGKTESKAIKINHTQSEIYTPDENNIVTDSDTGINYVNNIIKIYFTSSSTKEQREKIIDSINGEIVGVINELDEYQIKVKVHTLEELTDLAGELNELNEVVLATYDEVIEFESSSVIPNDPWTDLSNNQTWDESDPSGNNWWIESTQLISTWRYSKYFNKLNVGMVDAGIDLNHDDLNVTPLLQKNDASEHGTHVAGIICATHNNIGISGVLTDANLYSVDIEPANIVSSRWWSTLTGTAFEKAMVSNVKSGAKVINYSIKFYNKSRLKSLSYSMAKLLSSGYDFVIVQAAGNNAEDARKAGLFADLTPEYYTQKAKKETGIQFEELYNRIIVVGNAELTNKGYQLQVDSNFGDRIDIVAPGTNIYSTLKYNNYGYNTGTSMSAPIVTGIAGLVWSINENLTGEKVKQIVCNSVDLNVKVIGNPENHQENDSYNLVNAKLAVESALKTIEDKIVCEYGEFNLVDSYVNGNIKDKNSGEYISTWFSVYTVDENGKRHKYDDFYYNSTNNFEFSLPLGQYIFSVHDTEKYNNEEIYVDLSNRIVKNISMTLTPKNIKPEESDFIYRIENDEVIITGYRGTGGDILIPFYIEDKPVVMIDEKAFYENETITSVSFDGNLDSIGSYAFAYCDSLKSVSLKGMVTDIKSYAFNECSNLTSFSASEGVINISQGAFGSCKSLSYFGIQSKIEYIGNMAFFSCKSLYDFEYPIGANVNKYAFMSSNTQYKNDWIKF